MLVLITDVKIKLRQYSYDTKRKKMQDNYSMGIRKFVLYFPQSN